MIKQAGAILFSFLLLHAQVYALTGGPWDNIRNVYGTYSAVMVPDSAANLEEINEPIEEANNEDNDPTNDEELFDEDPSANSLGLFLLVVTPAGFAEGFSVLFVEGYALTGPVVGLGDPDSGEIKGLIENGVELFALVGPDGDGNYEEVEYLGTANGTFQAKLIEEQNRSLGQVLQRIEGSAQLEVDLSLFVEGYNVRYLIDGYRSSSSTDVSSITAPDFGNLGT